MSIDIEALKALCAAATPGPWAVSYAPDTNTPAAVADHSFEYIARTDLHSIHSTDDIIANAAFIAAARTALPALIATVEQLTKERDEALRVLNRKTGMRWTEAVISRVAAGKQSERCGTCGGAGETSHSGPLSGDWTERCEACDGEGEILTNAARAKESK